MTETITTKPGDKYRSIKNPRVYESLRREGHDKASAARISNARAKRRVVQRKSYTVTGLEVAALKDHDPLRAAAIAAQLPHAALKGEQLAPGVTRIHGDLCNVHGRWGSCSGAGHGDSKRVPFKALPKAPTPKGGKGVKGRKGRGARAAAKPKKAAQTDAERQQAQLAREARSEQRYQAHHAQSRAEREADQKKRETAQLARDVARQQERMRREMERQAKPAKGGGGGGTGKQPRRPIAARTTRTTRIANRPVKPTSGGGTRPARPATQKLQIAQELLDAVQMLSDGKPIDQATEDLLVRNGLARRVKGQLVLSITGLRVIQKEYQPGQLCPYCTADLALPDVGWYRCGNCGEAFYVADTDSDYEDYHAYRADRPQILRSAGAPPQPATLPTAQVLKPPRVIQKDASFAVFKDTSGAYRWIARTTTAYRDRDGEIISIQALEDDAARMTATGQYGPLRYWHVGQPDPLNVEAPWGPGLDIGDCDFSIVIGRTSIESGTFKSAEIGAAFAESADDHELSPGFFHAIGEPDAAGVFHRIRRFERSPVPLKHARASNLFTGLTVKEHRMDQATYDARVKAYLDFTREKGVPPEVAAAPLAAMTQADKDATERQIAFKEQQPVFDLFRALLAGEPAATTKEAEAPATKTAPEPEPPADPLVAIKEEVALLRAEVATLKAPPPPPDEVDAEDDPAQGGDAGADEAAEGEPPVGESSNGGLTLSTDDLAAIGQVIGGAMQSALEPLIGAMGITQKLEGHLGELKTMMGGYVKQKDDSEAQHTQEVAALKTSIEQQQAKLAELLGDQPRAGYRPTQAADNSPWIDPQVLAAIKDAAAGNGFEDLTEKLFPGILPQN
jgi:hypothetical protein